MTDSSARAATPIGEHIDSRGVPPDPLLSSLTVREYTAYGVPDEATAQRREAAADMAVAELHDVMLPEGLVTSPLGAAWAGDVDVHVGAPPPAQRLRDAGWIPLDGVLAALGHRSRGRWAAVDEAGDVLGAIDIHLEAPDLDCVQRVLHRCVRRGEVRLREVLELRVLARRGLLSGLTSPVLSVAAAAEAALGGDVLQIWLSEVPVRRPPLPTPRTLGRRVRNRLRPVRDALRPRLVVALSGVDGAGKSTLNARLRDQLEWAGVPASTVWARPGNHLGRLTAVAEAGKRLLGHDQRPGVAVAAAGETPARSRNRVIGGGWTLVVTLAFLADAWRQQLRSRGVVVWDRHVLDALATLDFAYGGGQLRLARALVSGLLPEAAVTCYLDVAPEVAANRKPGDVIGKHAIEQQLASYRREVARRPDVLVLDGTAPIEDSARQILRALVERCAPVRTRDR